MPGWFGGTDAGNPGSGSTTAEHNADWKLSVSCYFEIGASLGIELTVSLVCTSSGPEFNAAALNDEKSSALGEDGTASAIASF